MAASNQQKIYKGTPIAYVVFKSGPLKDCKANIGVKGEGNAYLLNYVYPPTDFNEPLPSEIQEITFTLQLNTNLAMALRCDAKKDMGEITVVNQADVLMSSGEYEMIDWIVIKKAISIYVQRDGSPVDQKGWGIATMTITCSPSDVTGNLKAEAKGADRYQLKTKLS